MPRMYSTARRLAGLTRPQDANVEINLPAAIELFQRCIDEHNHVGAMYDLAQLLTHATYLIDVPRAVYLFQRCIDEGKNIAAMLHLARILLFSQHHGYASDERRAYSLCERFISHGGDCLEMLAFAEEIAFGTDNASGRTMLAVKICEMCIEKCKHPQSLYALAQILVHCPSDVRNVDERVVQLVEMYLDRDDYCINVICLARRAANKGCAISDGERVAIRMLEAVIIKKNHPDAILILAKMLVGIAMKDQDIADRFMRLCVKYIDDGFECRNLAELASFIAWDMSNGDRRGSLAKRMLDMCVKKKDDAHSMIVLAEVLFSGTNGVERDIERGLKLCEQTIEKTNECRGVLELVTQAAKDASRMRIKDWKIARRLLELCIDKQDDFDATIMLLVVEASEKTSQGGYGRAIQLFQRHLNGCYDTSCKNVIELAKSIAQGALDNKANYALAIQLCQTCIKQRKDADAMIAVAEFTVCGAKTVSTAQMDHVAKLCEGALEENVECSKVRELAEMISEGDMDICKNVALAVRIFNLCITKRNDADSMVSLAEIYVTKSTEMSINAEQTRSLCAKAVHDKRVWYKVAMLARKLCSDKTGVIENMYLACEICQACIDKENNADAMIVLAEILFTGGANVSKDVNRAARLCEISVNLPVESDAFCFHAVNLARKLATGSGCIERNAPLAVRMYEGCVKNWTDCRAMYYLGEILSSGAPGVAKDSALAASLFRRASDGGFEGGYLNDMMEIMSYFFTKSRSHAHDSDYF